MNGIFFSKFRPRLSLQSIVLVSVLMVTGAMPFNFSLAASFSPSSVSPAMINQVKRLSPAEQRALAQQYGIDLPGTFGKMGSAQRSEPDPVEPLEQREKSPVIKSSSVEQDINKPSDAKSENKSLPRFGAQLYEKKSGAYAPVDEGLAPDGYLLGPGDELYVQVLGKDPIETFVELDRSGQITLPRIGAISLAGLSLKNAKGVIAQKVEARLMGSQVVTSLGRLRQISIFLAGEVNAPGNYNVSALTTISQALYLTQGITDIGSFREVQVRRGSDVVARFDLYDLLLKGDRENDVTLRSGDTVFVPVSKGIVTIEGAVQRPARYDLKSNETFADMIEIAGGFSASAFEELSTIRRFDSSKGTSRILTVSDPQSTLVLQDGDVVTISQGAALVANAVELTGAVVRPGLYEFFDGARVTDYLASVDRDISEGADLDVGLIVRRVNNRHEIELLAFDLVKAMALPGSEADPLLQGFDQVIVLPSPSVDAKTNSNTNQNAVDVNLISSLEIKDAVVVEGALSGGETQDQNSESSVLSSAQPTPRFKVIQPIVEKFIDQGGSGKPVNLVNVQGAVKQPGLYPLIRGGNINFMIQLAGGYRDGALLDQFEVRRIRIGSGGAKSETFIIRKKEVNSRPLQARDVVRVNFQADWNPNEFVLVEGEVRFPGSYALRDGETIGTVIERAGGFSNEAFPEAIRFTSQVTKELQQASARKLIERFQREQVSRRSVGDENQATNAAVNDEYTSSVLSSFQGRLVVDIPKILSGDSSADVLLRNGDKLYIPKMVESVTVAGEVYEPGSFRFERGLRYLDYIQMAAGTTDRSRNRDIYMIKPNGAVVSLARKKLSFLKFDRSFVEIAPGTVIVVPTNYDYEKPMTRIRGITSVVFESITSIAAFYSITKD
ncbi:SLBB domain-containing protein [Pseudomonadales bacterium]|nr:SLBB domain-containing protein [Pseudomonadales bacterium]